MVAWHFVAANVDGSPTGEISSATNRDIAFDLFGPASAKFTVDGRNPEATLLHELVTDLLVYRGSTLVFRGRLGSTDDALTVDQHTVNWSAVDYRGMLHRRQVYGDQTYTARDIADIAWDLISQAQALTGGNLRIGRGNAGLQGVGTVHDHVIKGGMWVDEAVNEMANVWGGFQWAIDPLLQFQAWFARGQYRRDFAVTFTPSGGNVTALTRAVDTSQYANVVVATGATGLGVAASSAPDLASRLEGRFEWQESATNRTTQALVNGAADAALAWHGALTPTYSFTLAPDVWSPGTPELGDTIPIQIKSGRLDVATSDRVFKLDVKLADTGLETVTVTTGQVRRDIASFFRTVPSRLDRLERT